MRENLKKLFKLELKLDGWWDPLDPMSFHKSERDRWRERMALYSSLVGEMGRWIYGAKLRGIKTRSLKFKISFERILLLSSSRPIILSRWKRGLVSSPREIQLAAHLTVRLSIHSARSIELRFVNLFRLLILSRVETTSAKLFNLYRDSSFDSKK